MSRSGVSELMLQEQDIQGAQTGLTGKAPGSRGPLTPPR